MANNQFQTELNKIVTEEIERLKEVLASPQSITTMEQHQYIAGQIFAYRRVINAYAEETNAAINLAGR